MTTIQLGPIAEAEKISKMCSSWLLLTTAWIELALNDHYPASYRCIAGSWLKLAPDHHICLEWALSDRYPGASSCR